MGRIIDPFTESNPVSARTAASGAARTVIWCVWRAARLPPRAGQDLEVDTCGDESERARMSKPEPPRHMANGIPSGSPTADGAEDFSHDATQPRRRARTKREDDVDVKHRDIAPAPR